jgi:hypothetical protein
MSGARDMSFSVTPKLPRRQVFAGGLVVCGVLALVWLLAHAWGSRPVEETVTTTPHSSNTHTVQAQAAPTSAPASVSLSAPHPGIERAGDQIAAAIVYLREQHLQSALRALNESRHTLRRVIEKEELDQSSRAQLEALLRELDKTEQSVGHEPVPTTIKHLTSLDDKLDQIQ